jgi:hypothetical protein
MRQIADHWLLAAILTMGTRAFVLLVTLAMDAVQTDALNSMNALLLCTIAAVTRSVSILWADSNVNATADLKAPDMV